MVSLLIKSFLSVLYCMIADVCLPLQHLRLESCWVDNLESPRPPTMMSTVLLDLVNMSQTAPKAVFYPCWLMEMLNLLLHCVCNKPHVATSSVTQNQFIDFHYDRNRFVDIIFPSTCYWLLPRWISPLKTVDVTRQSHQVSTSPFRFIC